MKKLYYQELKRIKKNGLRVHFVRSAKSICGYVGMFDENTGIIYIADTIRSWTERLWTLLHEEGHAIYPDRSNIDSEYFAQKYALKRAIELDNNRLIIYGIKDTFGWRALQYKEGLEHYLEAQRKIMSTKFWANVVEKYVEKKCV